MVPGPAPVTLLADIGATNARFALLANGVLGAVTGLQVVDFPRFADALHAFLKSTSSRSVVSEALLAVAGPVDGEFCKLTNCPWTIDASELRSEFRFTRVRLFNDFEATALSLPHLDVSDIYPLGKGVAVAGAPMAVIGPGTGLGIAGLSRGTQGPVVIAGEGGHSTMSGFTRREDAIIDFLRQRFEHVSAERALSGSGLENLYCAIAALDGIEIPKRNAAEITNAGLSGSCPTATSALDMFCAMLATTAGNAALMFGARGGVYIAGGIVPRIIEFIDGSEFRQRFESKGRLRSYLQSIPTSIIVHPTASLIGLKSLVDR
jgi:glucokinase